MDPESNNPQSENFDVYKELEILRRPELDPHAPLFRINGIIKTIENFEESEVYDAVALSKRCLDLYAEAAEEVKKHIAHCGISSAARLKILYQHNFIKLDHFERVKKQLLAIELPKKLVDLQCWHISPRFTQSIIQTIVAIGAFICSYFGERFIRKHGNFPESESLVIDLLTALGVFGVSFILFDQATDGIKERINWIVFRRTRRMALDNLRELKKSCEQFFGKYDALIPVPVKSD
jgi:hypothetical protein